MDVRVDWTATAASDWYRERALELRAEAVRCAEGGYGQWQVEFQGLAMIAERAADAELTNPPDKCAPCAICHEKVRCDLEYHSHVKRPWS